MKKWLDANCLSLNIDKTNFVIFHSPRTKLSEPIVIRFCRKKIQREQYVKFLGVLSDENLSWKYHINELSKILSRTIGIFHRTRGLADLLLDMGQMRMKPWKPNNELLEKNKVLYNLIVSV